MSSCALCVPESTLQALRVTAVPFQPVRSSTCLPVGPKLRARVICFSWCGLSGKRRALFSCTVRALYGYRCASSTTYASPGRAVRFPMLRRASLTETGRSSEGSSHCASCGCISERVCRGYRDAYARYLTANRLPHRERVHDIKITSACRWARRYLL